MITTDRPQDGVADFSLCGRGVSVPADLRVGSPTPDTFAAGDDGDNVAETTKRPSVGGRWWCGGG